jgi:hypothetical protein
VQEALRSGEVSIHRASAWLRIPKQQLDQLRLHQNLRGITRTIDALQRSHRLPSGDSLLDLQRIACALAAMGPDQRETVLIAEAKVPGKVLLLSPELFQTLTRQGELQP